MPAKRALIALAALVASASASAAQAGMGNINLGAPKAIPTIPKLPDVRPHMIDARIKLHCYYTRERNELGVWERRTHCR